MKRGLTSQQAKEALLKYGPNVLPKKGGYSALKIFSNQLKNPFSFVLIIAVLLSLFIGDRIDALLIAAILTLNTGLGFWQEYKASKELEALRSFDTSFSRVLRDGQEIEIPSHEIVPGDVVILEAGDKIPADGKLIETYSLQVNESILTGESLPVIKLSKELENAVYLGTIVVSGRGKFEVLQTGIRTRFGNIAQSLTEVEDEQTPLEASLSKLVKGIAILVLLVSALVFTVRFLQGFEITEVILVSIALMVAAVPEGLPAVVTIVLALGVHKMYQRKALVRKMVAVESLGAATVILSDKTGTLTRNEMRVQNVSSAKNGQAELVRCAVLCNSANLVLKEGGFDILGDTTEGALLLWAKDQNIDIDLVRNEGKLMEEIPFSLETRKMSIWWEERGQKALYTKGAPEVLIVSSKLSEKERKKWDVEYQKMAKKGLRVLAFSKDHQFLGLMGIADEVRPEAKEAIRLTHWAGIKVVMVTGDNELTAKAVGEEIGLLSEGDEVLTGTQLDELSEEELLQRIGQVRIFARITPLQKFKIVKAYQKLGEVVAVTGDGVNDALALKQAEVGVSMGKNGTDVSKEASDIVLLDDNLATLVSAIEQGRSIYSNIIKVVKFLLTGNFSEILLIGVASVLALPSPLLPVQILWINFVTDGLPALALGFDTPSSHIMRASPRQGNNILTRSMINYIFVGGFVIAAVCLLSFYFVYQNFSLVTARATVFSTMVILQMALPFIIRRHHSITSNKKLLGSVILMLILQTLIMTVPQLRHMFGIE